MGDQARFHFAPAAEPEGRVRGDDRTVRQEPVDIAKRNERKTHVSNLKTPLHRSDLWNIDGELNNASGPFIPSPTFRTPCLEHEVTIWAKRGSDALESPNPLVISEKDLRHIPRHHCKIKIGHRYCRGIAVHPGDLSGSILRLRDLKRCFGRVDTYDRAAALGHQDCQASCPATDVEDTVCTQLVGDVEVGRQIVAVSIKSVVDGRKAGVREDRIGHPATVSVVEHSGDRLSAAAVSAQLQTVWTSGAIESAR